MNYKEKKILILDDNPEILEMVQESLNIAGFNNLTGVQSKKRPWSNLAKYPLIWPF